MISSHCYNQLLAATQNVWSILLLLRLRLVKHAYLFVLLALGILFRRKLCQHQISIYLNHVYITFYNFSSYCFYSSFLCNTPYHVGSHVRKDFSMYVLTINTNTKIHNSQLSKRQYVNVQCYVTQLCSGLCSLSRSVRVLHLSKKSTTQQNK